MGKKKMGWNQRWASFWLQFEWEDLYSLSPSGIKRYGKTGWACSEHASCCREGRQDLHCNASPAVPGPQRSEVVRCTQDATLLGHPFTEHWRKTCMEPQQFPQGCPLQSPERIAYLQCPWKMNNGDGIAHKPRVIKENLLSSDLGLKQMLSTKYLKSFTKWSWCERQ